MTDIPNTIQLLRHCSVLFGDHLQISDDFLDYMQLSGVRSAYRRRVKETHPDVAASRGEAPADAGVAEFLSVRQSYEILSSYLAARSSRQILEPGAATPPCQYADAGEAWPWQPATGFSTAGLAGLPRRPLKLGDLLYHLGLVSWKDVIAALVWQKASRPRFGEMACRFGWLKKDDIAAIFRARTPGQLFGDTAVGLGILAGRQRDSLLFHQKIRQPKLGRFFIDNGVVDESEMLRYVMLLRRHNSLHTPLS